MVGGCRPSTLGGLEPDTKQMICCAGSNDSDSYETLELLVTNGWENRGVPPMTKSTKTADGATKLPKGAYRLPNGNYVTVSKWSDPIDRAGKRRIRIVAVHKNQPDLDKLAKALISLAETMTDEQMKAIKADGLDDILRTS